MAKEKKYDLRAFAQAHGLAVGEHCCYGEYGGFRIHIRYRTLGNPPCLLTIVTDMSGRNEDLEKYLERHKKELKISAFGVVGIGLMVCPQVMTAAFRQIEEALDKLVAYLKKNGFPGADTCPYCGKPLEGAGVEMLESGIPFAAHEACFVRARQAALQKERAETERPDRRLRGMVGALLGALAAVAVFFVLFLWWEFGALAAILGTMLGGWLYGKFGGKNTLFRVVFVAAVNLVLLLAAYALCLYMQAPVADSVAAVVAGIVDRLRGEVGFRVLFILNIAIIFVLDAVGTVYNYIAYRRDRAKVYSLVRRADDSEV